MKYSSHVYKQFVLENMDFIVVYDTDFYLVKRKNKFLNLNILYSPVFFNANSLQFS